MAALEVCLAAVSLLCLGLSSMPAAWLLQPMPMSSLGTQAGICHHTCTKNCSKIPKQNAMSILVLLGFKNYFTRYQQFSVCLQMVKKANITFWGGKGDHVLFTNFPSILELEQLWLRNLYLFLFFFSCGAIQKTFKIKEFMGYSSLAVGKNLLLC